MGEATAARSHVSRFKSMPEFCADFSRMTGLPMDPPKRDHPARMHAVQGA